QDFRAKRERAPARGKRKGPARENAFRRRVPRAPLHRRFARGSRAARALLGRKRDGDRIRRDAHLYRRERRKPRDLRLRSYVDESRPRQSLEGEPERRRRARRGVLRVDRRDGYRERLALLSKRRRKDRIP